MVKLTKIYTRTGDEGTTGLSDFSRISKTDARLAAYADVDEANSALGVAISLANGELNNLAISLLNRIQNELFDLGADLATPLKSEYEFEPIRVPEGWVADLENAIDDFNAQLPKLDSFILPGGTQLAASLHLARTIVRRAERSTWLAIEAYGSKVSSSDSEPGGVSATVARYLNRLSDLLFVLARCANVGHGGDVKWVPHTKRSNEV